MKLKKTEALLSTLKKEAALGTYALAVGVRGEETALFSDNADADTCFDVASVTKVLCTATLLLQALGEGRLSLDSTLDAFFDNVPADKKAVTVRHLLTHTSGINRFSGVIPENVAGGGRKETAAYLMSHSLPYPPGGDFSYSCYGYILLGFIAEAVFGDTLDRLFETRIADPLGLARSRFGVAPDEKNAALCYRRKDVGAYRVDDENAYTLDGVAGNAGLFVTLADMRIFARAFLAKDSRLYSRGLFDEAERDHTPTFSEGRGLGWLVVDKRYRQTGTLFPDGSVGHCGHTGQSFFFHRGSGLYVVLLTDATRSDYLRRGMTTYDYGAVTSMRERVHNAVKEDLTENGL